MIDPTPFEKAVKMMRQAQRILLGLESSRLHVGNEHIASLHKQSRLMDGMVSRSRALNMESKRLAYLEAGTNKTRGQWVKFYDDLILRAQKLGRFSVSQVANAASGKMDRTEQAAHASAKHIKQSDVFKAADMIQMVENMKKMERSNRLRLQKLNFKEFLGDQFKSGPLGFLTNIGKMFSSMGPLIGMLALFVTAIIAILGTLRKALKTTIELGYDATQRMGAIAQGQRVVADGLKRGANLDLSEVIQAQSALAQRLGTLNIDDRLVLKSAEISRQLGISADEAADLLNFFIRIRGQSADVAENSLAMGRAMSIQNRMIPAVIMRDVASNAGNFAKSARVSAEQLYRAAIAVRQMGTSLDRVSQIADRIVTDFEGTLEAQANIGAFAPGFDMSGLLVASQFGGDADVARELKSAVDSIGMSFDELPRSIKSSIAGSIGLPVEELGRLMNSQINVTDASGKAIQDAQSNASNELQKAISNPLDSLVRYTFGIYSLLLKIPFLGSSQDRSNALQEKIQRMSEPELKQTANSLPKASFFSILPDFTEQRMAQQRLNESASDISPTTTPSGPNKIERWLESIHDAIKQGGHVYLDGIKVGKVLTDTHRYGG
jgi:hypothetical protein